MKSLGSYKVGNLDTDTHERTSSEDEGRDQGEKNTRLAPTKAEGED